MISSTTFSISTSLHQANREVPIIEPQPNLVIGGFSIDTINDALSEAVTAESEKPPLLHTASNHSTVIRDRWLEIKTLVRQLNAVESTGTELENKRYNECYLKLQQLILDYPISLFSLK